MSESTRVSIAYAGEATGPASVVLKTASTDEGSRATGVGLGIYEREVRFYRELAPRIGGPLADCHFADDRTGRLVHDRARGPRAGEAGRPDRRLHDRAGAPGDGLAGASCTPPCSPIRSWARRRG